MISAFVAEPSPELSAVWSKILPTVPVLDMGPPTVMPPSRISSTTDPSVPEAVIPSVTTIRESLSWIKMPLLTTPVLVALREAIFVSILSNEVPIPFVALNTSAVVAPVILRSVTSSPARLSVIAPAVAVSVTVPPASIMLNKISVPAV